MWPSCLQRGNDIENDSQQIDWWLVNDDSVACFNGRAVCSISDVWLCGVVTSGTIPYWFVWQVLAFLNCFFEVDERGH